MAARKFDGAQGADSRQNLTPPARRDAVKLCTLMAIDDFSTLFDLLPIGAYRSSPDGRQLRANPALVRLDGYASEAEMLAATLDLAQEWYVDPTRREQFKAELAAHGRVVDFVSEGYRHKTRERIWVRVHSHVVRDAEGAVLYFEGTVQDITQEQQARLAVEALGSRLATTSCSTAYRRHMG